MKVRVYRMEAMVEIAGHHKWYGPFCAGIYNKELSKLCDEYRFQLSGPCREPEEDNPSKEWHRGMISGFTSYYQAADWLPMRGLWRRMNEAGFTIGVYEIEQDDIGWCDSQIFWHPSCAQRVSELSFDDLLDLDEEITRPTAKEQAERLWDQMVERNQVKKMRAMITERIGIPGRNDKCSCGSGKKYKKCCHAYFNQTVNGLKLFAQRHNLEFVEKSKCGKKS